MTNSDRPRGQPIAVKENPLPTFVRITAAIGTLVIVCWTSLISYLLSAMLVSLFALKVFAPPEKGRVGQTIHFLEGAIAIFIVVWFSPIVVPPPILQSIFVGPGYPALSNYRATIEPSNKSLEAFEVSETAQAWNDPSSNVKMSRTVSASKRAGFMLKEVTFVPLAASGGRVRLKLANGKLIDGFVCGFPKSSCPKAHIELVKLPADTFFQARNSTGITVSPWKDEENISWEGTDRTFDEGIAFTFVSPTFNSFRTWLLPFIGKSTIGAVLWATVPLILTFIFGTVVGPLLGDKIKDKLRALTKPKHKPIKLRHKKPRADEEADRS